MAHCNSYCSFSISPAARTSLTHHHTHIWNCACTDTPHRHTCLTDHHTPSHTIQTTSHLELRTLYARACYVNEGRVDAKALTGHTVSAVRRVCGCAFASTSPHACHGPYHKAWSAAPGRVSSCRCAGCRRAHTPNCRDGHMDMAKQEVWGSPEGVVRGPTGRVSPAHRRGPDAS